MGDSFEAWRSGQGDRTKRMGLSVEMYNIISAAGQDEGHA